jgi:serralysin
MCRVELNLRFIGAFVAMVVASQPQCARAYVVGSRWTASATDPSSSTGLPMTLSWSLVPDGTSVPNREASSLVSLMDATFGSGAGGVDLTSRPWFTLVDSAFARWSSLGGVNFVYEPNDDGAAVNETPGVLGIRGDVRLAAAAGDGPGRTLASSQFPNSGDVTFDRDEGALFASPAQNFIRFRNMLMHEIGHTLGLEHVVSSEVDWLMEPSLNVGFDGPQLDEVRGLHYLYGDRLERAAGGQTNDTRAFAAPLSALSAGDEFRIGGGANSSVVDPAAVDFVSISGRFDVDYFRIETTSPLWLNVDLVHHGGRYRQGEYDEAEFWVEGTAASDLTLALESSDGTTLVVANNHSRGEGEAIANFFLPAAGEYFLRVSGSRQVAQLYELSGRATAMHLPEPAAAMQGLVMTIASVAAGRPSRRSKEIARRGCACEEFAGSSR